MAISSSAPYEGNEEFRRWNNRVIQESAKMIRLVLVLLVIWTAFAIGWTINLIIQSQYRKNDHIIQYDNYRYNPRILYKRCDDEDLLEFENLSFCTEMKTHDWDKIKTFIGSFHRLRESHGKVPTLKIYIDEELDELKREEASAWNKVHFTHHLSPSCEGIWISPDYVFDSIELDLKRAELVSEAQSFLAAFQKGRENIKFIVENSIELVDANRTVLKPPKSKLKKSAEAFGLKHIKKIDTKSFACHVDLKMDAIINGAEMVNKLKSERLTDRKIRKTLAIGVPTTSKGMKSFNDENVLMKALIPSLKTTLTEEELQKYHITIFVGFDRGDAYFENEDLRFALEKKMKSILPNGIEVIFLRLKPIKRVAMTWNMIFAFARKYGDYDYYYQVNDDLTMKTRGWLDKFVTILDENKGFGVAGPSDSFNGFSCSLLTQAFVSKRHLQIFSGLFYPLSFKDWKSDRWLSFVYGERGTFCWPEMEATNGAAFTRYTACPFPEWKIELEAGRRIIKNERVS